MSMYLIVNIIGLVVFLGIGWLFSKDRKAINWKTVGIMVILNLLLAWFLVSSPAGRAGVKAAADGFAWIVNVSAKGTVFALGGWYNTKNLNFICSALMPILMIVPLFDILNYITASILGAYIEMMPGQYILTAVPINIINSLIAASMLNPVTVPAEDDTIEKVGAEVDSDKREPFFSFLGDSILGAGKLILIIIANVVAFVALAALIDAILSLFWKQLSLESILGVVMFPFSWLLGLPVHQAWMLSQDMGMKLVTNEFVVMGKVTGEINNYAPHLRAVLTVFVTSFANFGTLGMIIGAFKGLVDKEKNDYIAANIGYLMLSGILVSLLSAAFVGLFVW